MKNIENVSRRKFLKAAGLSSTSFILGIQLPNVLAMPIALAEPSASVFSPSVYLQIDSDNTVSVVVHRSEMGQGVRTSIPMIVADELEANWQQIKVVQGQADKKYGSQNTDGSKSIRQFFKPLRKAGATARLMLEQAAAQQWQVKAEQCYTKAGRVYLQEADKSLSFGELVSIAATLTVPNAKQIKLKNNNAFNFIGKNDVALVDGKDIATGNTTFAYDVNLPNMKIAVIARPPVLASKVKRVDSSKTLKIKGVIEVVQLDALTEPAVFKPLGGVAVIATNTWAAIEGRKALIIEWQESEHQQYNSKSYKAGLKESCAKADKVLRSKGNVQQALSRASKIITADYYVPALAHAPMEPLAAAAQYQQGKFEIWACSQTPQSAQSTVAQITGVDSKDITVNVTLLGGGFGRKSKPDFVAEAAVLAKKLNMPIKVLWTREDEIQHGYYHAVSYQQLSASFDEYDQLTAWQHHVALPTISATFSKGADVIGSEANLGLIDMPYNIENVRCAAGHAQAHTRIGWLRSVTNINHAFAIASFVDELAHAQNTDPKDYLLQLLGEDRTLDFSNENAKYGNYGESLSEFPVDIARFKQVINTVAELSNWGKKLPEGHGLGIAVHRSFVSYVACAVEVSTVNNRIKLENFYFAVDCGTAVNPERIRAQMEGAAVFATSLTFFGEITAENGVIQQGNFDDYPLARMEHSAPTQVAIIDSDAAPGGVGEPGVPPVAPAICNAIFAATGKRYRELPLSQYGII
jgi:isoquinoline 1-oxidoreductase beta subunit